MKSFLAYLRRVDRQAVAKRQPRHHAIDRVLNVLPPIAMKSVISFLRKLDRKTVKPTGTWSNKYLVGRQIGLACLLPTIGLIAPIFSRPVQAAPAYCSNLYAIDNTGTTFSKIYNVDVASTTYNGAKANSGAAATNTNFLTAAAAIEPSTGRIFYISRDTTGTRTAYWDPATNTHTTLGTVFNSGATVVRAAFSPSGRLFAATSSFLFEIDPTTGNLTGTVKALAGVSGLNGDMAFDGNGVLFLAADANLYTIDVDNLSATSPANLLGTAPAGTTFNSLGFKPDGKLYAFAGSNSTMYEVNTNTGGITPLGVISFNPITTPGVVGTDYASCAGPTPTLVPEKTYTKFSGSPGSTYAPGDVVEYTVTINNTGLVPTTKSTFQDPVPAETTYVAGSTTMNGVAVADATGAVFPFATAKAINSSGLLPGVVGFGTAYKVTIKYRIKINTVNPPALVSNQGTTFYLGGPTGGVPTDDPTTVGTDPTVITVTLPKGISGTVFEDPNYGGGAGRPLSTSGTSPRDGATLELYDSAGNYVSSTTTSGGGKYSFTSGIVAGNYYVRVVNRTVTSSRSGYVNTLTPVQTFHTIATTGTAVNDPNRVGGEKPSVADTGAAATGAKLNTANFIFTTAGGSATNGGQAESITPVTVGSSAVSGIDFGYNFDTIVNTNDSGQGSLRQFVTNSNTLTNTGLAQVGQTVGKEVSIFMVPSGAATPGIQASVASQLTGGVAVIDIITELPQITDANTSIDGTTQTTNVGDNNTGQFGTGGTVGVDNISLAKVNKPEVELSDGGLGLSKGLQVLANDTTIRGMSVWGFGKDTSQSDFHNQITVGTFTTNTPARTLIEQNIIGTKATDFSVTGSPGRGSTTGSLNSGSGIYLLASTNTTIQHNLIGFNAGTGILSFGNNDQLLVSGNELRSNGTEATRDGVGLENGTKNSKAINNLIIDNAANGVSIYKNGVNSQLLVENNTIQDSGRNYWEEAGIAAFDTAGGKDKISKNIITGSRGAGIWLEKTVNTMTITQNSIYSNGGLGIDLKGDTLDTGTGNQTIVTNTVTPNDGSNSVANIANTGTDYPIITSSVLTSGNLTVKGFVGTAAIASSPFAGATLEFFVANNSPANQNGEVIVGDGKSRSHGEGQTYIGGSTTGNLCIVSATGTFNCTFPSVGAIVTDPKNITATTTDTLGNTSEFSSVPSDKAKLVLVKRITAIKDGVTNLPLKDAGGATISFSAFVDDTTSPNQADDNHCNWKGATGTAGACTNTYTVGATTQTAPKVKPGDEIEYTIYYLNSGENAANPARVCDQLNPNLTFSPQGGSGIGLAKGTSAMSMLTNATAGNDGGELTTPALATSCNLPNNGGTEVVVVDVGTTASPLAGSTGAGAPVGSYGYVRFKAVVK